MCLMQKLSISGETRFTCACDQFDFLNNQTHLVMCLIPKSSPSQCGCGFGMLYVSARAGKAVLLIGEQGTAKTVMINGYMAKYNPEAHQSKSFNFSSATTPYMFQVSKQNHGFIPSTSPRPPRHTCSRSVNKTMVLFLQLLLGHHAIHVPGQ